MENTQTSTPLTSLPHYVVTSQDVGKTIRSITRGCTRRHISARPQPQMLGQLPIERITPGPVYAGPHYIKYGYVRKPTVIKAYVNLFHFLLKPSTWSLFLTSHLRHS